MSAASSPPPPSPSPAARWLHLWTPTLATDRLRWARPDLDPAVPLAVTAKARNALRLVAVDARAADEGLAPGLTLKEARRLVPSLLTAPQDPAADRALADRLLALCRLTAPGVVRDGAPHAGGGFALDVTGAARVHGGEAALAAAAAARFAAEGVAVRWALADTAGLAWAVALFGTQPEGGGVVPPGAGAAALAPLPVEALRLSPEDAADLRGLGFRRIGPLLGRVRDLSPTLEGRLGARLDAVLGATPTATAAEPTRPRYVAARTLPQPIAGAASVLAWTRRLLEALEPQLSAHGRGARALELVLTRADGQRRVHRVRTRRPQTDPAALGRLFEGPLGLAGRGGADEAVAAPGTEIEALRLEARVTAPLRPVTGDLLRPDEAGERRFDALVESLCARLGDGAVEVPRRDPATLKPEREVRLAPLDAAPRRARPSGPPPLPPPPAWDEAVLRPLRLFDPPEPVVVLGRPDESPPFTFAWRRLRRRVVRAEGPERLAPEWGREAAGVRTRDYYRVEDADGRRYWLYREGLYGDEAHPAWFVQGVFA